MLIDVVLILNAIAAIAGGYVLYRKTHNYSIYLFELIFCIFFVARPLLITSFGLSSFDLLRFGIGNDAILTYAVCGLVFTAVFHWTVFKLYGRRRLFSDRFFRICNFDRVSNLRLASVFLIFAVLTYLVNAFIRLHSLTYFAENLDSFAAGTNLVNGLWFVEVLSSVLIFPLIVVLARNLDAKPIRLCGVLVIAMVGFAVIAKPSTRTATIALMVAVAIFFFSTGKARVTFLSLALVLVGVIALMFYLNGVRAGNVQIGGEEQAGINTILVEAFQNAAPADNAMILVDYQKNHAWLYFRYLLPSLSPSTIVPRALFPFKSRTDIEAALTYDIFGFDLDPDAYHEGSTLTYTVPGAGYADLSYLGVAVASLLYGFVFSVFLRGWKSKSPTVRFLTLYYSISIIAGLRLSDESLLETFYWTILATWGMHALATFRVWPGPAFSGHGDAAEQLGEAGQSRERET
jgi:oligosaccharide repeat unit polymerase